MRITTGQLRRVIRETAGESFLDGPDDEGVAGEIGPDAEKSIGLSCSTGVDLARRSYITEMNFLKVTSHLVDHLKE